MPKSLAKAFPVEGHWIVTEGRLIGSGDARLELVSLIPVE